MALIDSVLQKDQNGNYIRDDSGALLAVSGTDEPAVIMQVMNLTAREARNYSSTGSWSRENQANIARHYINQGLMGNQDAFTDEGAEQDF